MQQSPLANPTEDDKLRAGGKAFQLLSDQANGMRAVDIPLSNGSALPFAFEKSGDTVVVFVASRRDITQNVDIELGSLVTGFHHVWAKSLDVKFGGSTSASNAGTVMTAFNGSALPLNNGQISLSLNPYELVRLTFTIAAHGVTMDGDFQDAANDTLTGSSYNDTIRGFGGDDSLFGALGKDVIGGGLGNDTINGGAGNDALYGGLGNDLLIGGLGDDTLYGGMGLDTAHYGGSVAIRVNLGLITGQNTGHGIDTILEVENIISGSGDDTLLGNADANDIRSGGGNDSILGGSGNDFILGEAGNDTIIGGPGSDTINGGLGNDLLNGSAGVDQLTGMAGQDVFYFSLSTDSGVGAGNRDIITDFTTGQDKISFAQMDANTSIAGIQTFGFSNNVAAANSIWRIQTGSDTIVRGDVNGDGVADFEIQLNGATGITVSDFIL